MSSSSIESEKFSLEACLTCQSKYDRTKHQPKVLPCSHLVCSQCLETRPKTIGIFSIKCGTCGLLHGLKSLADLPTSQLVTSVWVESDSEAVGQPSKRAKLEHFLADVGQYVRSERFEINKHYDSVVNDIDIRAESLINYIHNYR